jgi:hypothetical protein
VMVRRSRIVIRLLAAVSAVVVIGGVACSASPVSSPVTTSIGAASAAKPAAAPAPAPPAADAAKSGAATSNAAGVSQNASAPLDVQAQSTQPLDRMVIRTAQLTIEVTDIEQALAQVRAIAAQGGGFVSGSNTHIEKVNDQERNVADLTIQVRSETVDSSISALRALGKVTTESTGSQDVTEEYVDLDSNLRNLQASESAILKLMSQTTRIEDVVSLQRELTNIRGQIERIQGRKRFLERRAELATITLSLRLPATESARPTLSGAWDPIAVALRGWQASLTVLRAFADVVIVVIAFSWWLVPIAGAGAYVWLQRRRPRPQPEPTSAAG